MVKKEENKLINTENTLRMLEGLWYEYEIEGSYVFYNEKEICAT